MSNLETALRKALQKGDAHDGEATPEKMRDQTSRLSDAIETIERELAEAARQAQASGAEPVPQAPPVQAEPRSEPVATADRQTLTDAPPPAGANVTPRVEPDLRSASAPRTPAVDAGAPHLHVEPRQDAASEMSGDGPQRVASSGPSGPFRFRRGPFATVFLAIVLIALLFAGLWWVMQTDAFVSQQARDTSVPNPPVQLGEDAFAGRDPDTATAPARVSDADADGGEGWIVLFTPSDPTVLTLVGGAQTSIESDPFGDFARLSTTGAESAVLIDVPVGTLQRLAGSAVQISVRARTDDGQASQISVTCDFGPLGDCGRRRFDVNQSEAEFLFRADLLDGATPSAPGSLEIRPDFEGGERAINLLSVRIRAADG